MINYMVIEMNYVNPDNRVPESERSNRVIKWRFRIAYYRLPYKNIPSIMIHYLEMNVTRNLDFFPPKGGLLAHYIPHLIMSQSNWIYNKHFQVEFSSYVQSSQANDPNNTNFLRTLDGIYLCLAPNF